MGGEDLVVCSLQRCQSIYESHLSLWRWLLIQQGLVVKRRLHKIGVTDAAYSLYGKDEKVEHGFWRCRTVKVFGRWSWFQVEYHFVIAPLSWKGTLLGDTSMIRES